MKYVHPRYTSRPTHSVFPPLQNSILRRHVIERRGQLLQLEWKSLRDHCGEPRSHRKYKDASLVRWHPFLNYVLREAMCAYVSPYIYTNSVGSSHSELGTRKFKSSAVSNIFGRLPGQENIYLLLELATGIRLICKAVET